jgi:hypothetical protein
MRAHRVRALLMGGQACVFYGAAEFSRDTDFAILADPANLARLEKAEAARHRRSIKHAPLAHLLKVELRHLTRFRSPAHLAEWLRANRPST